MQNHRGVFTQVIKNRSCFIKKQRQVVLNAGGSDARAHVFVNAAFGRVALQQLAPAAAKLGPRGIIHGELAPGQQTHIRNRVKATLAIGVKGADAVNFVVK